MRNIDLLPNWVMTKAQPMQYDSESATGIEMVAKMYAKMQEIVEHYNEFAESVNKGIKEFETLIANEYDELELGIRQEFKDFIDIINLKVKKMDNAIKDNETEIIEALENTPENMYMKLPIAGSVIVAKIAQGNLVAIKAKFDGAFGDMNIEYKYVTNDGDYYYFMAEVPKFNNVGEFIIKRYIVMLDKNTGTEIYDVCPVS